MASNVCLLSVKQCPSSAKGDIDWETRLLPPAAGVCLVVRCSPAQREGGPETRVSEEGVGAAPPLASPRPRLLRKKQGPVGNLD